MGSVAGGAAACSYPQKGVYATGADLDYPLSYNFVAGSFTTTSAYTVVRIGVTLIQVGTAPNVQITAYLYDNSSDQPSTLLGTSTDTISATTVSLSRTEYYWNFAGIALSNTTKYHIVLTKAYTDASNAIKWTMNDGGATAEEYNRATTLPTWTTVDTSISPYFSTYSCD